MVSTTRFSKPGGSCGVGPNSDHNVVCREISYEILYECMHDDKHHAFGKPGLSCMGSGLAWSLCGPGAAFAAKCHMKSYMDACTMTNTTRFVNRVCRGSKHASEHAAKHAPKHASEHAPKHAPEHAPEDAADHASEHAPRRASNHAPDPKHDSPGLQHAWAPANINHLLRAPGLR